MPTTFTPADLEIQPRNIKFNDEAAPNERWWAGGDPIATAWYNALSITFPAGETFFIESVRRFEKDVPDHLGEQIKAFVKQEAFHTREHNSFNSRVKEAGYDIARMEADVQARLDQARDTHPVVQLGLTTALEHFTAIFAHSALKQPDLLAGADMNAQRMWGWHAIEEIEHKAVAFDTYRYATRDVPKFKRWMIRSLTFLNVSRNFLTGRWREALELLEQDGITGIQARWKLAWLLWGKPGVVRRVFFPWLAYFRPGFHPWQIDDRDLITDAQQRLGLT